MLLPTGIFRNILKNFKEIFFLEIMDYDDPPHVWPYQIPKRRRQRPIGHYLMIESVKPHKSISRRTYGETLSIRLKNFKHSSNPASLLERIFESLIQRLLSGTSEAWGPPKFIGIQIMNEYMEAPFYVPLRPLSQNNPGVIAAHFTWLARQSGGRLRIFKSPCQAKLYGVWPLGNLFT